MTELTTALKQAIGRIEQRRDKSDIWKFRALMGGVAANAKYASAAVIGESPRTPGYLGEEEIPAGLLPEQYAHHAAIIADHALDWGSKITADQKEDNHGK